MADKSASQQIDDIISNLNDWRGKTLATLRTAIQQTNSAITEEVKWKKPSKPQGVPVWTYNDKNVCIADTLKDAVRLNFPQGAQMSDPKKLFNARLDGNAVRAIDFHEGENIDTAALKQLITEALAVS